MPGFLGKLSAMIPTKPKPVESKSMDPRLNMPLSKASKITRLVHIAVLSLLVLLATIVIILKAMSINFMEDNRDTGFEYESEGKTVSMAALPKFLYVSPTKLVLIAGTISIFIGIGHLLFVLMDWKQGIKTQAYAFRRNLMFVHFANGVLILFALVSLNVAHRSSSHFNESYIDLKTEKPSSMAEGMRYGRGTFDLETWSCELMKAPGSAMVWDDYAKQCAIETAGRGMMIPFLIVGWALCALSIWGMIGGRKAADSDARPKTVESQIELGKVGTTVESREAVRAEAESPKTVESPVEPSKTSTAAESTKTESPKKAEERVEQDKIGTAQ